MATGLKNVLIFVAVCVGLVALGLAIFYFSKDNESITINSVQIDVNKGETFEADSLITRTNPSDFTTIKYGVKNSAVLSMGQDTNGNIIYTALTGGSTQITINTNQMFASTLKINVAVHDGTVNYPYVINTEADLQNIGADGSIFALDDYYVLNNDITLANKWVPIGYTYNSTSKQFSFAGALTGGFDGQGHTITDLSMTPYGAVITEDPAVAAYDAAYDQTLNNGGFNYAGFAAELCPDGVTTNVPYIKNLFLSNIEINSNSSFVGGIVAFNGGNVQTCEVESGVVGSTAQYAYIGGIAGFNQANDTVKAHIDRCASLATIMQDYYGQMAGGIAGANFGGDITECFFNGQVNQANGSDVNSFGGIVGGNVWGDSETTGGAISSADIQPAYVGDCYAIIYIASSTYMGGIIGHNIEYAAADAEDVSNNNQIFGNYFIVMDNSASPAVAVTTAVNIIGVTTVGHLADIVDSTGFYTNCTQFTSLSKFADKKNFTSYTYEVEGVTVTRSWNFDTVWYYADPAKPDFPLINFNSTSGSTYFNDPGDQLPKNGTEVTDEQELYDALYANDANIIITKDINCTFTWKPIMAFSGILQGIYGTYNGEMRYPKITNLVIERQYDSGAQAQVDYPSVITGDTTGFDYYVQAAGFIVGLTNSAIINGLIFDTVTVQNKTGLKNITTVAGTLAAFDDGATIMRVTMNKVTVNMSADCFGGIVGIANRMSNNKAIILECNVNNIQAGNNVAFNAAGGFVGRNGFTDVILDKNGNVTGSSIYNGVTISGRAPTDSTAAVYSTAKDVTLIALSLGGIAGFNNATIQYVDAEFTISLNSTDNASTLYSANNLAQISSVAIGGVAGRNYGGGTIVYAVSKVTADVQTMYDTINLLGVALDIGGVVGENSAVIWGCLVDGATSITTTGNYYAAIGGVAGYNDGRITLCYVQQGTTLTGSMVSNINGLASYVGGFVGDSGSNSYIIDCASFANVTGFFAGGFAGYTNGSAVESYAGDANNPVAVTGFFAGGFAGAIVGLYTTASDGTVTVLGGQFTRCYAVVTLTGTQANTEPEWDEFITTLGVMQLKTNAKAGFAVFISYKAQLTDCYVAATFVGGGANYSTTLSWCGLNETGRDKYRTGSLVNCAYTTQANSNYEAGYKIDTTDLLDGSMTTLKDLDGAGNGFNEKYWTQESEGQYITIAGLSGLLAPIINQGA